jgi:predicted amidohydrolase YtcJ
MKIFISILSLVCVILSSCESKEEVDLLVINDKAYTVDADFSTAEAFAVKEGKIVEVGSTSDLSSKYTAKETLDAEQKTILPGLIDAHAHLYNLGLKLSRVGF